MKFQLLSALLVFAVGSTAIASDCKDGKCPLVQVPKAVVQQSAAAVSEVASAPVKVAKKVRSVKPVRSFLRKVFGR
jgi:hypothetical protein